MSKKLEIFLLCILVVLLGFLRFYNLGHSEYIPDETTVLFPLKESSQFYTREFFLSQRKGPMQFVVTFIPFLFDKNIFNEGFYRIPFALASSLSFIFFYLFVRNISGRKLTALLATFLLGVCGLTVGLGRIVQYQSLNMLFSFMALYFYSEMLITEKHKLKYSLLGTLFCCISLLSHWDAVFYFPIMFWTFGRLFIDKSVSKDLKIKIIITNLFLSVLLLVPFLVPYVKGLSESNIKYFETRVGVGGENNTIIEKLVGYKLKAELYNPFVYTWFILGATVLAFIDFRRTKALFLWFIINFGFFLLFIRHEGTHLYNLFIPLSILSGFGITLLIDRFSGVWKTAFAVVTLVPLLFFFYQSFMVFADVSKEYPFEREVILGKETRRYTNSDLPNNVIGFPIRRGWVEINKFIKELGYPRYITNENQSISNFYVGGMYGAGEGVYYIVGVRKPLSFTLDYSFPQVKGKHTVKEIEVNGSTTAKIYIVDGQR